MARQQKIRIEVTVPVGELAEGAGRANEMVLPPARLIGRQMAREDFERRRVEYQSRTRPEP